MKIDYLIYYPGGNTTALVTTKVDRNDQTFLTEALLHSNKFKIEGIEQVGFIEITERSHNRMQMAANMLCINASRSFMAYEASLGNDGVVSQRVEVELSGFSDVNEGANIARAEVIAKTDKDYFVSWEVTLTELLESEEYVTGSFLLFGRDLVRYQMVRLKGITHIVLIDEKVPESLLDIFDSSLAGKSDQEVPKFREICNELERLLPELKNMPVYGLMAYKIISTKTVQLCPLVKTKEADIIFYETGCGSGTVAASLSLADAGYTEFIQPSGESIHVEKMTKNGEQTLRIDGDVSFVRADSIQL